MFFSGFVQNEQEVHNMLNYLASADVSLHIIQKTRIGLHVNTLRKIQLSDEINQKAKKIVKSWKKFLEKSKTAEQSSNGNGHAKSVKGLLLLKLIFRAKMINFICFFQLKKLKRLLKHRRHLRKKLHQHRLADLLTAVAIQVFEDVIVTCLQ